MHPGQAGADAIDAQLHAERLEGRERRLHPGRLDELPDGAFIVSDGEPRLVLGAELLRWSPSGYGERTPRPAGTDVVVVTPPSLVAVLRAAWEPFVPLFHPSARGE